MSNVAKQIYRKINDLFPNLHKVEAFTKLDLAGKGHDNIHLLMLEPAGDELNFILTRYNQEEGRLIANPAVEIIADSKNKTANVVTYKDHYYFHSAVPEPDDIGEIALCQANRFLYDWLIDLNSWNRSHTNDNHPPVANFSPSGGTGKSRTK